MPFATYREGVVELCHRLLRLTLIAATLGFAVIAPNTQAHVLWTRVNTVDPANTLGLYHFNDTVTTVGAQLAAAPGLPLSRNLVAGNTSGPGAQASVDVNSGIFGPGCLQLTSVQTLNSSETLTTATVPQLVGDITVEFWMKWPSGPGASTSSSLVVGLGSGAKIQVTRDSADSSKDKFGIATVHGGYASVPGFTNWVDVGTEEAPLDDWIHVGMCAHSTGVHVNTSDTAHLLYDTGSVARFFLNGHQSGTTLDISNTLNTHDYSNLRVAMTAGTGVFVDEVTIWGQDWSNNGTNASPFSDGRGPSPAAVTEWTLYE